MSDDCWNLNGQKVWRKDLLTHQGANVTNGVSITPISSFGCVQYLLRRNAYYVNDDQMMYLNGKHLVLYDTVSKRQSFMMKAIEDEQVTAMSYCITKSNNLLVAVTFRCPPKQIPNVRVYNQRRNRYQSLIHSHLRPNSSLVDVGFMAKGKQIVTLSRSNDSYTLTIYEVKKETVMKLIVSKHALMHVTPLTSNYFMVSGPRFLGFFACDVETTNEETNLVSGTKLNEGEKIIDCATVQEQICIVLTDKDRFLIFKDNAYLHSQDCIIEDPLTLKQVKLSEIDVHASTICCTSRGIILGTIGKPILQLYEIDSAFKLVSRGSYCIKDSEIYGISSIDVGLDEMYAAVSVVYCNRATKEPMSVVMEQQGGRIELFTFNLGIVDALRNVQKDPFEGLNEKGVHRGVIYNICVNQMSAILCSVCEDRTMKIWSYGDSFKQLISHQFHEVPNCIAIHPTSLMCAIGFKEGMRLYFILDDDIRMVFQENMKNCNILTFSDGGHILAVSNQANICLYNPQQYKLIMTLSNHQANLRDLYFQDNDSKLVSSCQLGVLYVWDLRRGGGERIVEHSLRMNKYTAIMYDHFYDLLVGLAEGKLRVYSDRGTSLQIEQDTYPTQLTCICTNIQQYTIFFGTAQGAIRTYSYPFYLFNPKLMDYVEVALHQTAITSIKVSPDYRYLITSSMDGSIYISSITQFADGQPTTHFHNLNPQRLLYTFAYNPLVLTSYTTRQQRTDKIKELDFKLQNFKVDIDDEKEKALIVYNANIATQEAKNAREVAKIRDVLSTQIQKSDQAAAILRGSMLEYRSKGLAKLTLIQDGHSKLLIGLYEERDDLNSHMDGVVAKQKEQQTIANKEYQVSLQQVDEEYLHKYQELYSRFSDAIQNMKTDQRKFKEVLQQGEREYETFYKKSQEELQTQLTIENKKTEDLRSSISKFSKENERLLHRRDFLEGLIKDSTNQVITLQNELQIYEEKQRSLQLQLSEKEDTINQREQQIKDYRMKNIHLQNFQKVYDYRVSTLKEEKEPLMGHLKNMDKHVRNLYNELIDEAGVKQKQDRERTEDENRLIIMQKRLTHQLTQVNFSRRQIEVVEFELSEALRDNTKNWQEVLTSIHSRLASENKTTKVLKHSIFSDTMRDMQKDPLQEMMERNTNNEIQRELSSQKQFLEKKLVNEQASVAKALDNRKSTYYDIQSTNTQLINECNTLRDTKQRLKDHIDKQNKALREVTRELEQQYTPLVPLPTKTLRRHSTEKQLIQSNTTPYAQYQQQKSQQYNLLYQQGSSSH